MKLNPLFDFIRHLGRLLSGKIRVSSLPAKSEPLLEEIYRPFLKVNHIQNKQPGAVLQVKFRVFHPTFRQRVLIPRLGIPFFSGAPGFIAKVFYVNQQGDQFCGLYQWETEQDAQNYIQSYPGAFMKFNALPGSLQFQIHPIQEVSQ